jgi:hypothetical protein
MDMKCGLGVRKGKEKKKFWEELIANFPWYDTGNIENDASNNSSIACVFVTRGNVSTEPLPSNDRGFLPSRCLVTIGGYTYRHTLMGGIF